MLRSMTYYLAPAAAGILFSALLLSQTQTGQQGTTPGRRQERLSRSVGR